MNWWLVCLLVGLFARVHICLLVCLFVCFCVYLFFCSCERMVSVCLLVWLFE